MSLLSVPGAMISILCRPARDPGASIALDAERHEDNQRHGRDADERQDPADRGHDRSRLAGACRRRRNGIGLQSLAGRAQATAGHAVRSSTGSHRPGAIPSDLRCCSEVRPCLRPSYPCEWRRNDRRRVVPFRCARPIVQREFEILTRGTLLQMPSEHHAARARGGRRHASASVRSTLRSTSDAFVPPKPKEFDKRHVDLPPLRLTRGTRSIGVSTEGLSRLSVGGTMPSRIASAQKIASTEPAAPSRWPIADFVDDIET